MRRHNAGCTQTEKEKKIRHRQSSLLLDAKMFQTDQFSIKIRKTKEVQKEKKRQHTKFADNTFIADEAIINILDMINYKHHDHII